MLLHQDKEEQYSQPQTVQLLSLQPPQSTGLPTPAWGGAGNSPTESVNGRPPLLGLQGKLQFWKELVKCLSLKEKL